MDTDQLTAHLSRLFDQGHRIVFWQDQDSEFLESLPKIALKEVTLIHVNQESALAVKARVTLDEPQKNYLLYESGPQPDPVDDWLLDIRLYAAPFAADRATMHLKALGLQQASLRNHLAERATFLASKERLAKLKSMIQPDDQAEDIDRAMLAILTKADQTSFAHITIALLQGFDENNLDDTPPSWKALEKYGLDKIFWEIVATRFHYQDKNPTLKNLLIRLLISDLSKSLHGDLPQGLDHLALSSRGSANAVICLGQWRDSSSRSQRFEILSATVAELIRLEEHLSSLSSQALADVRTFLLIEKILASRLRDQILETIQTINLDEVRHRVAQRQDGYWATDQLLSTEHAPRYALHRTYDALLFAAELFDLQNKISIDQLNYTQAKDYYYAYTKQLYRVDQCYRLFYEATEKADKAGWDILKPLKPEVEACYGNWFIHNLGLYWGKCVEPLLRNQWKIDDIPNQQTFYQKFIYPTVSSRGNRRIFLIISDAFRYEAAKELTDLLNGQYRLTAELQSQLGVLPSYTALGMAALLPHQRLDYHKNGTVLVDDQSSSGFEQRKKILAKVKGVALKADQLLAMKKTEGRAFIRSQRLVTIYHNRIDAIGDAEVTEKSTFAAVRETIDTLAALVTKIINDLNGTQIVITADHGFLFQMDAPSERDKNILENRPQGAIKSKKRYLIGNHLPTNSKVICGSTETTAGTKESVDFWLPKGANRFHFVGGARFIHGGAMLQEIVVPVIKVQQMKGKSTKATRIRSVPISLLGHHFKITTNRHRFTFIQSEPVSERVKPLSVRIAIYEEQNPVTNVAIVTFDSQSQDMNQWRKEVRLTLAGRTFDKKKRYQLIARNADTSVDVLRIDVTIDLAFFNDF
ncbi:BREX-1 system phosphatase PglZ type A [Magnetococcales bacterium HHB-1]